MCNICKAVGEQTTPEQSITFAILVADYFGYPHCCALSFIHKALGIPQMCVQEEVANYSFVPCPLHAMMIKEGKIKLEDIILPSRVCKLPFPKTGAASTAINYARKRMKTIDCQQFVESL